MTDNEIIKALECCSGFSCHPKECPLQNDTFCAEALHRNALALINRQKAEIERLQSNLKAMTDTMAQCECCNIVKAEAVKEFALELKRIPRISVYKNEIDNLLREMVGEDK